MNERRRTFWSVVEADQALGGRPRLRKRGSRARPEPPGARGGELRTSDGVLAGAASTLEARLRSSGRRPAGRAVVDLHRPGPGRGVP